MARELSGRDADDVIDLATFGSSLLEDPAEIVDAAMATVRDSTLLIVASPTYKATYTGLLKLFLDRIGTGQLLGTVAVPLMLGGSAHHALAPEAFLKPVLSELGASVPTKGLFLLDSSWQDSAELAGWLPGARVHLHATLPTLVPAEGPQPIGADT